MAKFDIIKHKQIADERRRAKNPNLANPNTTGVKITKSGAGLFTLIFLGLNVYSMPISILIKWVAYLVLTAVYVYFLKKAVWK